jgi:fructoselysine transporter
MPELTRKLGLGHIIAIIIGTVIGSGVFINLPIVAGVTGSPLMAALAWLIGGLILIPQIFIVTEMATAYPEQGFGYLYLRKAGSPLLAFLYVWTVFITSDTPSITIIALSAISSLAIFWPAFNDPLVSRFLAIVLIIVLTIPHIRDVRKGGNLQVILTLAKIVPLVLLVIVGFFYFSSGNLFTPSISETPINLIPGILFAGVAATVWSYAGFTNILYMAGEVKNPHKTLPKALIGSVIGVMISFVLISLTTSAIVPHSELVKASGTFVNPFQYLPLISTFAAGFLAIAAFINMIGATNACIMVQPRIEYAIARDGLFFKPFAHIHPKFQTPDYSILIQSGLAIVMALIGGIESLLGYFTLSYILQNALIYCAIFWLRKKPDYKPTYKAPLWRSMTIISIVVQLSLAYGTFLAYSIGGVVCAAILMLTGLPIYFYFKKSHQSSGNIQV